MKFIKYHALGNDYIVIDSTQEEHFLVTNTKLICDRHFGAGSDGILYGPLPSNTCDFKLKIFNPDGTQAEKSGNGIRIFARSLLDRSLIDRNEFTIETKGGKVSCKVSNDKNIISVEMGKIQFGANVIPVLGFTGDVIKKTLNIDNKEILFCAATIGNPHCVVISEEPSKKLAMEMGPKIENNPCFPNKTNVQFMKVLDRSNIKIEIWERGAGYTLASGSSSVAAAAVAYKLGLCDSSIIVHMPGGQINIILDKDFNVTMIGPVVKIYEGDLEQNILVSNSKLFV